MQGLPKHEKKIRFALKIQENQNRLEEKKEWKPRYEMAFHDWVNPNNQKIIC